MNKWAIIAIAALALLLVTYKPTAPQCPLRPISMSVAELFTGGWSECSGIDGTMQKTSYVCNKTTNYEWKVESVENKSCCGRAELLSLLHGIDPSYYLSAECSMSDCSVLSSAPSCGEGYLCVDYYRCIGGEWKHDRCARTGKLCPSTGWTKVLTLQPDVGVNSGSIACGSPVCAVGHSYDMTQEQSAMYGLEHLYGKVFELTSLSPDSRKGQIPYMRQGETIKACYGGQCCPADCDIRFGSSGDWTMSFYVKPA